MHGIRKNTYFLKDNPSVQLDLNVGLLRKISSTSLTPDKTEQKVKQVYGHTIADVEQQILDWQNEMKKENPS